MKKGFMIAAAVLMGVGLALVWSVLIFSDADFTKFDWEKYQTNTYTAQGDITKIEINLKQSDVELIVSAKRTNANGTIILRFSQSPCR